MKLPLKDRYEKIVNTYINQFCEKHEVEFDGWIGERVGEIAWMGMYPISFDDIRHDIDNKIATPVIWNFLDAVGEGLEVNFQNYLKMNQ